MIHACGYYCIHSLLGYNLVILNDFEQVTAPRETTEREKREERREKREARSEKREERREKREARSEKREARSEKRAESTLAHRALPEPVGQRLHATRELDLRANGAPELLQHLQDIGRLDR